MEQLDRAGRYRRWIYSQHQISTIILCPVRKIGRGVLLASECSQTKLHE
jgi:hypothetical protein